MKTIVIFLSTLALFLLMLPGLAISEQGYKEIDAVGVKELMDKGDPLVVFPLSPMEFDNQHIEGSVNIIPKKLESELPANKGKAIVFYCLGIKCVASWRAAEKAVALGYKNVYAFREGIPGWEKEGYPLVSTKRIPDVEFKKISTDELATLLFNTEMILLDINLDADAHKFHIESTKRLHIPLDELNGSLSQLPKDKKIAVMCLKGKRSATAARYLIGLGYTDVVVVEGGIQKWVMEGKPVKREVAAI